MEFKSRHLLAKEMAPFADLTGGSDALATILASMPECEVGEKMIIDGAKAGEQITLYVYRPHGIGEQKTPAIYCMHGGGYILGHATMMGDYLRYLAEKNQATVFSVEYRLATEAPFPADLMDAYTGLQYVYANADSLLIDKDNIVITGESAGGGLCARLALYNRDHANIPVKGEVLIYPMLDHRTGFSEDIYQNEYAGEFLWTKELNRKGWDTLRGGQEISEAEMLYFSPARASVSQLVGLPKTFMIVGALDLFANEDLAYASNCIRAGVSTEIHMCPGAFHAYDTIAPDSQQSISFCELRDEAIRRMLTE